MISVAMAAYNGARFIKAQLESIAAQTLPVDEVVICDDRSSDDTVQICRDFIRDHGLSGWSVRVNEENRGFCFNYYGAIAACSGDVIFLADQDDVWRPDRVACMTACMAEHPEISVLASRYDVIDAKGDPIENSGVTYLGERFDGSLETVSPESLIGCSYIRGFSLCMKREIAERIAPIDLKSLLAHDWQICMLGCLNGGTAILNTVLTDYRYHGDNVSLSAMDKTRLVRRLEKRIAGLRESIAGHRYILSVAADPALRCALSHFIRFEERRLQFLTAKNPFRWLALGLDFREYSRYYKGGGLRVWLGDFVYAYRK